MLDKLRDLGYRVEWASGPTPTEDRERLDLIDDSAAPIVYHVEGFNVSTYVRESDTEAWRELLNTHAERAEAMRPA